MSIGVACDNVGDRENRASLARVIMEPAMPNLGVVRPEPGYLEAVREEEWTLSVTRTDEVVDAYVDECAHDVTAVGRDHRLPRQPPGRGFIRRAPTARRHPPRRPPRPPPLLPDERVPPWTTDSLGWTST